MSTLKTGPSCCSGWVLGMLPDLEDNPLVAVVEAPHSAFVLKAGSSGLGRWMDSPFVRGGEFPNCASLDKGCDCLFEGRSCGEGPYGGPLSLERDRRGGIVGGFA
jgi:hypothetical protein